MEETTAERVRRVEAMAAQAARELAEEWFAQLCMTNDLAASVAAAAALGPGVRHEAVVLGVTLTAARKRLAALLGYG
jgi:hypothetical protein